MCVFDRDSITMVSGHLKVSFADKALSGPLQYDGFAVKSRSFLIIRRVAGLSISADLSWVTKLSSLAVRAIAMA